LKHDAVKKRIKEGQAITILQQEEFYTLLDCPIQLSLLDLVAQPVPKKRKASSEKKTPVKKRSVTDKGGQCLFRSDPAGIGTGKQGPAAGIRRVQGFTG
jgi:hypothetical protein